MDTSTNPMNNFNTQDTDTIDIKQLVLRYLRYWPWFVLTLLILLFAAYSYLRYAPRIYESYAKVKILDESDGLELPSSAFVFKRSNINLENEKEILTSYLILSRVVRALNLNTRFYEEGTIQTTRCAELPFAYEQKIHPDSIVVPLHYKVSLLSTGLEVTNLDSEKLFRFPEGSTYATPHRLPFNIDVNTAGTAAALTNKTFLITFIPVKTATLALKQGIVVEPIGEQSDLLKLSIKGESKALSEQVLNTLMAVFDEDGINDRQLVSKRTLDFIDERFVFLAQELDSIEISYQDFKQDNNLVDLTTDASLGLEKRTQSEEELFKIAGQLALANLLKDALSETTTSGLLPANIGLDNDGINRLIANYNSAIATRDKLSSSGGSNNPTVQLAAREVQKLQANINTSLQTYTRQLETTQRQLASRNREFSGQVAQIPEQERLLKIIARQQKIKQSLYVLLLQKREEAAINLAITEPSIKVVDYALSGSSPIAPKSRIVYGGALLGGLLLPFAVLYLMFLLDTKVTSKEAITNVNPKTPVIGEIPDVKKQLDPVFRDPNDRSAFAEAFRILSANVDYMIPGSSAANSGKTIFCTSTIKGEGKTYVSLNLSLALASINKKVLLIGADLRNPQIHTHIQEDKQKPGLSNYLHDVNCDWNDLIIKGFDKQPNHDVILSGTIPPNPAHLLTNGRFTKLIEGARARYDYVIVDTAPTILVTDTMLISQLADVTVYLVRADYTEKKLLNFSKDLAETGKLKNMAYVLNAVGARKAYGYNYGYNYGYAADA